MTQPSVPVSPALVAAFAPNGTLRASINLGNPILANKDAATGAPVGVSVDMAREFARRLGVDIELVQFEKAAASVDAVKNEKADIGFFAIDPARSEGLLFTAAYVLIEGSYLVPESSPLTDNAQIDARGHRISVGSGSAYDLFLTREIKAATLVRAPTSPAVTDMFLAQNLDVAAGVRQQLEADARRVGGVRMLPGRFMVIEQAMAVPKGRTAAQAWLSGYIEEMKASGFVAQALVRHGIEGAAVAPARA